MITQADFDLFVEVLLKDFRLRQEDSWLYGGFIIFVWAYIVFLAGYIGFQIGKQKGAISSIEDFLKEKMNPR